MEAFNIKEKYTWKIKVKLYYYIFVYIILHYMLVYGSVPLFNILLKYFTFQEFICMVILSIHYKDPYI